MDGKFSIFSVGLALILFSCNTNEAIKSDTPKVDNGVVANEVEDTKEARTEKVIISKDFLDLEDLIALINSDNLDSKTIAAYLKTTNKNWKLKGSDNEEIYFIKDNEETQKELLTYHYKKYILEYLTFSKNHFFKISTEIKNQNFEITNEKENEYGGQITTYSSDKMVIMTEEVPLTEPGKSGFKILIAQKR
ncbi:MAG: hypothetical protein JSS64_10145 [Bacteroidetes bacterium]|nr:hypothetical protein [Bacteroidota bacterium]